jgi:chromate transporter
MRAGIIAVNVSTFIGRHVAGWKGALAAAVGMVFPSFAVIVAIAAFITSFSHLAWVRSAFAGIRACVCVLVLNAAVGLVKRAVVDPYTLALYALVFAGAAFLDLSPVLLVLLAVAAGVSLKILKERGRKA